MAIEQIDLELIDDNPYQTRLTYHKKDIDDIAISIKTHGLLQVPLARRKDGKVELGFGHLRKRAFLKLAKEDPTTWGKMPLDIRDLTDDQMALFALEENLKRRDITPIEVARAVDNYLTHFPDKTETDMAQQLNMTQGNIANMRRVLRLPEKILEKVDQARITFTQARELVILEKLENSEELMLTAIRGIRTEGRGYGHADTVEGMQASIHDVISARCRPLDKAFEGYRWDLIFDTRTAGCLECEKMVRTHPTKSATAHYCLDDKCWDRHQEEQREKVSAEAKAKMEADIVRRAAEQAQATERLETLSKKQYQGISQEIPEDLREPVTAVDREIEQMVTAPEPKVVAPAKTYRIQNRTIHKWWEGKANSAQEACEKAGWPIGECFIREKTQKGGWGKPSEAVEAGETIAIPQDILALAREKAGTRAEVLDLKDIGAGYYGDVKPGYALLDGIDRALEHIIDPEECLQRCTHGFHFSFDSRQPEPRTRYVCSDTKCLVKKKAAFTRAKNAEGQAQKNAERKAMKEAVAQTTTLDRSRIKLILLAQMDGSHTSKHYYGSTDGKQPETWLWEKISAGTPAIERERKDLFKRIDKLSDEELAKLVVEFMFYYLTDKGDIGSYEIKTTEPLSWMGIAIKVEPEGEDKAHA